MRDITPEMAEAGATLHLVSTPQAVAGPVHRLRVDRTSLSDQRDARTRNRSRSGLGTHVQQRVRGPSGLELVRILRAELQPRFRHAGWRRVRSYVDRLRRQQFKVHQVDLGFAELRAGPRFVFLNSNGASIKPYVAATGSLLADQVYSGGIGGGVTVHANVLGSDGTPSSKSSSRPTATRISIRSRAASGGPLTTAALQAVRSDRLRLELANPHRLSARGRPLQSFRLQCLCRRMLLPWNFSFPGDRASGP